MPLRRCLLGVILSLALLLCCACHKESQKDIARVKIGMSRGEVEAAAGKPKKITTWKSGEEQFETWSYPPHDPLASVVPQCTFDKNVRVIHIHVNERINLH